MGMRNRIRLYVARIKMVLTSSFIIKILFFLLLVLIIIALPVTISIFSGLTFDQYIKLIENILAWPTAILILGLYFLITYRTPIEQKIKDLVNAKAFNSEWSFKEQTANPDPSLIEVYKRLYWEQTDKLNAVTEYLDQSQSQLIERIRTLEIISEFNEFMYLNEFLVSTTKNVFRQIAIQAITVENYDISFSNISPQQRHVIKEVLKNSGLISEYPGNLLGLTEKGNKFLNYLNWRIENFGSLSILPTFERAQLEAACTVSRSSGN